MSALPVPTPTPVTAPYWEHAARGELAVQRCVRCRAAFLYPRISCPECGSGNLEWFVTAGTGTLQSYVIVHRAAGAFAGHEPYSVAIVKLDEGLSLLTTIVDVEQTPEALELDMRVRVRFADRDGVALPVFAPDREPR